MSSDQATPLLPDGRKQWLRELLNRWKIPSLGITVGRLGKAGWAEERFVHGPRSVDTSEPMLDSHLFAIASNSKFIAALALSMLLQDLKDQGRKIGNDSPSWKSRVQDILPGEFVLQDKYIADHCTLEDMLSMNWGMPRHDHAHKYAPPSVIPSQLPHFKVSAELRGSWQYCNIGYNLIPLMFHRLLGSKSVDPSRDFIDYVQRRIFDPLGLHSATYDAEGARLSGHRVEGAVRVGLNVIEGQKKLAAVDAWKAQGRPIPDGFTGEMRGLGVWTDLGSASDLGAGGVIISLSDLGKLNHALLDPPEWLAPHLQRVTAPQSIASQSSPEDLEPHGSFVAYGLGQRIWHYRGHLVYSHGGDQQGQSSWPIRVPAKGIAIWVTTGEVEWAGEVMRTVALSVLDDLLGVSGTDKVDWEQKIWYESAASQDVEPQRPKKVLESPAAQDIEGEYFNPGYGTLSIKRVTPESFPELNGEPIEELRRCGHDTSTVYAARLDAIFESHLVLMPWSGNIMSWSLMSVYPRSLQYMPVTSSQSGEYLHGTTGGKNPAWRVDGYARCVLAKDGLGMFERFGGPGGGSSVDVDETWADSPHAPEIREKAEVWFTKHASA